MDAEETEQWAGAYDPDYFCACGAEKNPDFPKCFMCGKKDRQDLDDWVAGLQYSAKKWDEEPF